MKIDVPSYAGIGWLCTLLQEWPFARDCPPADSDICPDTSRQRPSDVIFLKDVQNDNVVGRKVEC